VGLAERHQVEVLSKLSPDEKRRVLKMLQDMMQACLPGRVS
jgi:hypothetical protein